MTFYQEQLDAATVARRLGGERRGANDWRLPHLCGGSAPGSPLGDNPGLSIGDGDDGLIVACHYGCNAAAAYTALHDALGLDRPPPKSARPSRPAFETGRRPCSNCGTEALVVSEIHGTGWPRLTCDCGTTYDHLLSALTSERWTAWAEYWLADGRPRRQVRPFPHRSGKSKSTWAKEPPGPDGKPGRRSVRGLTPLVWGDDHAGNSLVMCEGEKAAAALVSAGVNDAGYTPVSTQAAAGMRNGNYAALVSERTVVVWPDADDVNQKTGRREGPEAAAAAVPRIWDAGATAVLVVDIADVVAAVPPRGKTDGADAADVPPDLIPGLLARASSAADTGGASVADYPWYAAGDFVHTWECTPDADMARAMRMHAGDLLAVVTPKDTELMVAGAGGVWTNRVDDLNWIIAETALTWATAAAKEETVGPKLAGDIIRWQKRTAAQPGRKLALDSVGRVAANWRGVGMMPPAITQCKAAELDANTRYLGAPNGVIDLETGELLTGAGARRCLVSRCLPDPYDPDATHEAVDKLLSHLGDSERDWLLSAFGHALRGQPNRRNYLLVGEGGGGKTTLMTAVGKALGDHAGFIAAGAIAARKYAGGPEPELEAFTNRRLMFYSEPPPNLDHQRLKNQSGGDVVTFRRMYEGDQVEKPTMATRVFACNRDDVPSMKWTDKATFERLRALPYPALPQGERDLNLPRRLNTKRARQAIAALLVRYAVANPEPPEDIPSVAGLREELRAEEVGDAGTWLKTVLVPAPSQSGYGIGTTELWEAARAASGNTPDSTAWGYTRQRFVVLAKQLHGLEPPQPVRLGPTKKLQNGWRGWRLATDEEQQAHFERMLSPTCTMPDCDRDAVPSSRFCEECESLAAGPTAQAKPQQQAVPVEVAAETLSKRQTEAVELLARRPDLSQSVRELLERVSLRLRMVGETPPLLSEDMPAVVANDPESVLDALLGATDATAFARVLEAQREAIEDQDAMDSSPEGHDERL